MINENEHENVPQSEYVGEPVSESVSEPVGEHWGKKRFALIVTYESGKAVMLTDTLYMDEALKEFNEKHIKKYGVDKSSLAPRVIGLEILPLMYESVYTN